MSQTWMFWRCQPVFGLLVGLLVIANTGCEESGKTTSLDAAMSAYDLGRYDEAHEAAVNVMRGRSGIEREKAAYVAGMSAYRSGDMTEAEIRFLSSAQSSDGLIAGRSKAGLGLIRLSQHRVGDARSYFREAAALLPADESREAQRHANEVDGETIAAGVLDGRYSPTKPWTQSRTGFAIQVGAFNDEANAREAAASAQPLADRFQLGTVRVISRRQSSGSRYVVQFGSFTSRSVAASLLSRIGRRTYVVAPLVTSG